MKRSLSERKDGVCPVCEQVFALVRHDQVCCSTACRRLYKNSGAQPWSERPDREAQNAARRLRYRSNRAAVLAKQKVWRESNRDLAKQRDHEKYLRRREAILARCKAYRAENPHVRRTEYQNLRQKRPWYRLIAEAKRRASKRCLHFALTLEWAEKVWTGKCAVTGLLFELGTIDHFPRSPSIDRIDSTRGYEPDNCRFVLFAVNSLKGRGTDADMIAIARAIVSNGA